YWGGWFDEAPQPASATVVEWVRTCDPKPLVIVDSFVAFQSGNENDAVETRRWMHQCRLLASMGATVLVLHHTGKGETAQDFRGSSDFKAAIDQGFVVGNIGPPGRLGTLRLRCFKSRLGLAAIIAYESVRGHLQRKHEDVRRRDDERMRELLRRNPGVTA